MLRKTLLCLLAAISVSIVSDAKVKSYTVDSPDGAISVRVDVSESITYSVTRNGHPVLSGSRICMSLSGGRAFGEGDRVLKSSVSVVDRTIPSPVFKRSEVRDHYKALRMSFKEFDLVFRAYDDGVAYRFEGKLRGSGAVEGETAEFNFPQDCPAVISYIDKAIDEDDSQFVSSQEYLYSTNLLSEWNTARIACAPLLVCLPSGERVCLTESGLEAYPGLNFYNDGSALVRGTFARCPALKGDGSRLEGIYGREDYLVYGPLKRVFPWRCAIIVDSDRALPESDFVWRLGKDPEGDFSWVAPGKAAWDWWSAGYLEGVDFEYGTNTQSYCSYIDFAAAYGIEYFVVDAGWSDEYDMTRVTPGVDIQKVCDYAAEKGVKVILWGEHLSFDAHMEELCAKYSAMGVKGFKIDYMNRDDKPMVDFYHRAASTCARYGLLIDFHGSYKPSGLERTWPNVINYEGIHGLENVKWSTEDQVTYDVTAPFVRMVAGPVDYTPGAMRNASRDLFRPVYSYPESMGTRCRQLALYIVYDAPLSMLCDSPSAYAREQECTRFIASVPTVWDETRVLEAAVGKKIVTARRKGDEWFVGGLTGWDACDAVIDLSFLPDGLWEAELFCDGVNAARLASDYRRKVSYISAGELFTVHMAPGGGFALHLRRLPGESGDLLTPWAADVRADNVHPEYPRPQLVRDRWLSLNGMWDYATTGSTSVAPEFRGKQILVPFPAGSPLSGTELPAEGDLLWYRREFEVPREWSGQRIMLNFDAVDWEATVYVNGKLAGSHTGGYAPWSLDVTPYLSEGLPQQLLVKVSDPTDSDACIPHGKQSYHTPGGIWYTPVSGIWQSVWIEPASGARITGYSCVPSEDFSSLSVSVRAEGLAGGDTIEVFLKEGREGYDTSNPSSRVLCEATVEDGVAVLPLKDPHLWSPESPFLYGLGFRVSRGKEVIDIAEGYTGVRTVGRVTTSDGYARIGINGKAIFNMGTLDQGWWPDGLYTAPTDEALADDVRFQKELGFNMIRKHIKVEPARWFYHCDRLGMMVWQDMPSIDAVHGVWNPNGFGLGTDCDFSSQIKDNYYKELGEIMDWTGGFCCIVMWVPFNEGWGQFDTWKAVDFIRSRDTSRLVNPASGGNYCKGAGDVLDCHNYPNPVMRLWDMEKICVLGEFGGVGYPVPGHLFKTSKRHWGYVQTIGTDEITSRYEEFATSIQELVKRGLAGAVYTQTTDVESEVNGLKTYDRKVLKFDPVRMKAANRKIIRSAE